jgi:hypothetical protein
MTQVTGIIAAPSNTSQTDGTTTQAFLQGKQGELLDAKLHGDFYTQAYRGNLFFGTTATAGTTIPIQASGLASTFTLYNPASSGKILELLEEVDAATESGLKKATVENGDSGSQRLPVESLVALAGALSNLRTSEQNDVRLQQNVKRLAQKDEEIALAREKFQRETCALFLKWHADQHANELANADTSNAEKIERLGQLMFGETWAPATPATK